MDKSHEWDTLAKIVYRRTYARKQPDGSLETWPDTVDRVIRGNTRLVKVDAEEQSQLREIMLTRKGIPAGRGLWQSGTETQKKLGGVSQNNCFFWDSSNQDHFVYAQDYLMLGGGVGLSSEHQFVSKLPKVLPNVKISHQNDFSADFIVPDTREGWDLLLRLVLKAYLKTGKGFTYSTKAVRAAGEPIGGFGGTSSGPGPLIKMVDQMCALLNSRANRHVRPIDAADLICMIGQQVVAGNVRRSAIIILGDCWDKEFLAAKQWQKGNIPNYRAFANYSVVCSDVDDLHPSFWKTFEYGEPFGIINRKAIQKYGRMGEKLNDSAMGVNPCQPEFAPMLTPDGIRLFSEISEGDTVWSGKRWTKVINKWSTGIKPVYEYRTTSGVFIGTDNHKVFQRGEKIEVKYAEQLDVCKNCTSPLATKPLPEHIINGLVLGDGSVHKASNNLIYLCIGKDDNDYFSSEIAFKILERREGLSKHAWKVDTTLSFNELPKTYERVIPDRYFHATPEIVKNFLRGLYSANGSVVAGRITLKGASKKLIQQTQLLLSSVGIQSYITTNKAKEVNFENGKYLCKESYDLNITSDRAIFYNEIGFLQKYKMEKIEKILKTQKSQPKSSFDIIEKTYIGDFEVFDMTVDAPEHSYWTGGVLVSNCAEIPLENGEPCCLVEIPLMNLTSEDEFIHVARLLYRYAKRVTLENYHNEITDAIVKKNHRIGVGITGCLASPLFNEATLARVYSILRAEDKKYSAELGVLQSIRLTTIKPSGTVSKLLSQNGYEGIHPAYSRYFIQRIRFSSDDALLPLLRTAGHHIEPQQNFDGTLDHGTQVVDFYVAAPENYPVADESWDLKKQLDTVLLAQRAWSDNSVSVTVYYKKTDIPFIKKWLKEHLSEIKSISFLLHSEHGFIQAPKEAITKEIYEKAVAKLKPIAFDEIFLGDFASDDCAGGVCPIK